MKTSYNKYFLTVIQKDYIVTAFITLGIIYTLLALSPSSYSIVLKDYLNIQNSEPYLFKAKPIRSDEWAVWTPYLQATANNDFERFNETSIYKEDLRNFNSLPLFDWALIFKPQYWLFVVADPAYAFSFYHSFIYVAFILGYYLLFIAFGFKKSWSIGASIILLFSSCGVTWWTTLGPTWAFFPWVILVFLKKMPPTLKIFSITWVTTTWLLSHLYPPAIISLAFVGCGMILTFNRKSLNLYNIRSSSIGTIIGILISYLYLSDIIYAMSTTIYPGDRTSSGGTVPFEMWLSHFFPHFIYSGFHDLINRNVCEVSVASSYLAVLIMFFIDYKKLRQNPTLVINLQYTYILITSFIVMSCWMLFPIPYDIGKYLLWNKVPPERMTFASGLLLMTILLSILRFMPISLSQNRYYHFSWMILVVFLISKFGISKSILDLTHWDDFIILVPLGILIYYRKQFKDMALILISSAAIANILAFGSFNPIQSSIPIFQIPENSLTKELHQIQFSHPKSWLAIPGYPGSVLNGLGFQSASHVLVSPKLEFFRNLYPEMPESNFNQTFNRYAHIQLEQINTPYSPQADVVRVPISKINPDLHKPVSTIIALENTISIGGAIDRVFVEKDKTIITGWGWLSNINNNSTVQIIGNNINTNATITRSIRLDVEVAHNNSELVMPGFTLTILKNMQKNQICLITQDTKFGSHLLTAPNSTYCDKFKKPK